MMYVARPTNRPPASSYRQAPPSPAPTRMAPSTTIKSSTSQSSGQLTREQIDTLLEKLRDPSLARKFLMDAGLIDADGQLTRPYRSQDAQTA